MQADTGGGELETPTTSRPLSYGMRPPGGRPRDRPARDGAHGDATTSGTSFCSPRYGTLASYPEEWRASRRHSSRRLSRSRRTRRSAGSKGPLPRKELVGSDRGAALVRRSRPGVRARADRWRWSLGIPQQPDQSGRVKVGRDAPESTTGVAMWMALEASTRSDIARFSPRSGPHVMLRDVVSSRSAATRASRSGG